MRVVFDTNLLVAASRSNKGASYQMISMLPSDEFELAISSALYFEYLDVLLRPNNIPSGLHNSDIINVVNEVTKNAHFLDIFFRWRPWLNDADDDMILELALASQSDFIVTFNVRDFRNIESFGIQVITPADFLGFIRGRSK